MARRRSKSWYISRLVRASGIVKDEVVNVSGGSADSDVAIIAELRRDADSEELQIQSIRTAIDSDYALFNAKIAAFNGLTDSDLTTVAKLRNDVDSDSLKIQALKTTVNNLPTPSGGVSLTEVTDSDGREAISSPIEGDIAIQYGVGPGINTGVTHNFSGGTVLSWSTPNFNNDRLNLTNATLAAVAQPGDILVIESATVQRYNSYWSVNTWQTIQSGTLIAAIHSVSGSVLTIMIATQVRYATGHTKSLNTSVSDYFGNASNPRGSIPVSAAFASSNDANVNGTTGSQKLTGGVATLYRMFKSDIQSARETSARTNSVSNDESGNVNALNHAEAKIYVYQDSDDLTNSGWKNTIASNDDVTTLQARVDSESAKVQTINGTVAALQNSVNTLGGVSLTEVIDSDGREGISSPKEGDIAIQYGSYAGTYTGISHDFTVNNARSQLWAYTVYARSANSLTYDYGNGRFQWSNSTFNSVVQKGDVIVVEDGFAQTTPGVNSGGVNYNSGYYGTFIFVCHTPQVGAAAPYYNIQAAGHVLSPSSIGFTLNSSLYGYFNNSANPRGSVPSNAQVVRSYMNINNSSAAQILQGRVAKLYRFFDPATYADGYDNNGTADPYNGSNDATINALPYNQAKIYVYQDSDDLTNRGWKNTIASNDDVIVLQARADSESAKVQTINNTVAALQNSVNTLGGVSLTEVIDSDSREAISSPKEGDIAIQYGSSPGLNTGVTYNFGGGTVLSFDVPLQPSNYSSAEMTLTNATFAAAAQPGDVIVVQNSTIRYYVHPNYYNDQGTYNGTLIMAVLSVVNSTTLKVMFRNTFNFPAQSSSGYVNSDLYNYFGNPANPRGDIPSNALVAGPTVGNTFNYWSSKQWIGGVATLYRMFDSTILSAYGENPSGTPHVYNDDFTGSVTPLPYSKPEVYIYQDSDDLTPRGWKSPFKSFDSDQIVSIINENVVSSGSVDSDVAAIAELRRDADSDSIRIQEIATSLEQINELVDSDLKAIADLRNDLDSESAVIKTLSSAGSSPFTDSDSIHRIALKSNPISLADSRALSIGKSLPDSGTSQVGDFFISWDSEETIYQLRPATQYNTNMLSVGSFASNSVIYTSGTPSGANNATTPSTFPSPIGAGSYTRSFHTNHSNGGGYITFTFSTPTPVVYFYVTGSDPNARIQRINYENGDYALNASNSNPSFSENITWYGTTQSKVVNGNGSFDARHPDDASIKVTSIQFRTYDRSWVNYYWLFMSSANEWVPCGRILDSDSINKIITENSSGFATTSFDSDQIVAIINENTTAGSIDSDVAAIAELRRDADSDSIAIQSLRTSIDSDYALFNAKFALLNGLTDSDLTTVSNLRNDLDSESAEIRLLRRELDSDIANIPESTTNVTQRVYSFTSSQPTTTFSGNDDNGQTLSYSVGRIQVYLNGLLLTEGALKDYTATNGTSVVLTEATDSDDILTVAKFLGTPDDVITNKYIYKVSPAGNHTPFDSEFTGVDENGTTLSYTPGKIQVFLNGVLLQDSDDYTANNGSTITLLSAPDSEDVLVVYRYLGTQVAGFDSEQVVAIINENASTLPWVEKTSSVAVTAGQKIIVDTSTAVTLTLPASASLGDEIRIIDGTGTAATNNITVARNGHNIMGSASDLTINLNASGIGLVYYNASRGWILIEN